VDDELEKRKDQFDGRYITMLNITETKHEKEIWY